jgi:hypothetical protein
MAMFCEGKLFYNALTARTDRPSSTMQTATQRKHNIHASYLYTNHSYTQYPAYTTTFNNGLPRDGTSSAA